MRISDWSSDVCSSDLSQSMIGGDINELRDELIHAKQEFDAYHYECEHGHASTDLKTYMSLADPIVESRKAFLKVLDELTLDALDMQSIPPDDIGREHL